MVNGSKKGSFLLQHANTDLHKRLAGERKKQQIQKQMSAEMPEVACEGMRLADPDSAKGLHQYAHHFKVFMGWMGNCPELKKHHYVYQEAEDTYIIRHGDCKKTCRPQDDQRPICSECTSLSGAQSLRKRVAVCGLKKFAADLLSKRLFDNADSAKELEESVKQDVLYLRHKDRVDKILGLRNYQLQSWVRSTFCSMRRDRRTDLLQSFMDSVVSPCLCLNVTSLEQKKPLLLQMQQLFQRFLTDPNASDMEKIQVQIASSSVSGKLDRKPFMQGLLLTCLREVEREMEGKTLRGRIGKDSCMATDAAQSLSNEAGEMLAIHTGNVSLLKRFGFGAGRKLRDGWIEKLHSLSLPAPFLSLSDPEVIRENMNLIDQRLSEMTGRTGCGWASSRALIFYARHFVMRTAGTQRIIGE